MKPFQSMNTESKGSKPAEDSNATRHSEAPSGSSQNPSNLLKQAAPATAKILSHASEANSMSKDVEQHSRRPQPPSIEGIFFIRSPERELSEAKKIDKSNDLGLFGEFIKKCTLCKKEFQPNNDVYMYGDQPFCSSDCRDDQIAATGSAENIWGLARRMRRR
ncbi:hypothetical protein BT93_L2116 [Corymbia citriodora subsp. variegata]|uniref:FLZ-type domain-containing protein n=1 Tax=Corymbia citriodora subsp. variegata TaxID=360336 RepID=A0A8T0CQF9_CORYI|nr:hypothetical protein BT93_L2116 [Corymbia citriodora subsp. variegata]